MIPNFNFPPFDFYPTDTTTTLKVTFPERISPYTHTQKDVDEAYCKGYNEGLKVHGAEDVNTTCLSGNEFNVNLLCAVCNSCKCATPYAEYCMHCGKKIILGGRNNEP